MNVLFVVVLLFFLYGHYFSFTAEHDMCLFDRVFFYWPDCGRNKTLRTVQTYDVVPTVLRQLKIEVDFTRRTLFIFCIAINIFCTYIL